MTRNTEIWCQTPFQYAFTAVEIITLTLTLHYFCFWYKAWQDNRHWNQLEKTSENSDKSFAGSSNQMEIEGVERIVAKLNIGQKIIGFVHGQYVKMSNYIRYHWNTTEWMDNMCAKRSFLRYLYNFRVGNVSLNGGAVLRSLKKNIESYRNFLVHSNFSSERADMLSINGVEHYKGNHTKCLHAAYMSWID